jgi:hypothetical protein
MSQVAIMMLLSEKLRVESVPQWGTGELNAPSVNLVTNQ